MSKNSFLIGSLVFSTLVAIACTSLFWQQTKFKRALWAEFNSEKQWVQYLTPTQIERAKLAQWYCARHPKCTRAQALEQVGRLTIEIGE